MGLTSQPCGAELVERSLDGGANLGVEAFAEVFRRDADAKAADWFLQCGGVVGDGTVGASCVHGILAGEDGEHGRRILDSICKRPDAVERTRRRR